MNAPTKETMAKYLQLTHWNKLLYEKGVITQREYLRMTNMIRQKYPVTPLALEHPAKDAPLPLSRFFFLCTSRSHGTFPAGGSQ